MLDEHLTIFNAAFSCKESVTLVANTLKCTICNNQKHIDIATSTSEKDAEQRARGIIQQFLRHTQSTSHQDAYMSEHGAKWTKPDSSHTMYVSIVALMSLPRFEHVSTTFDVVTREDGIESTCFKCSSIIKCNTSGPIRFCMNMEQHAQSKACKSRAAAHAQKRKRTQRGGSRGSKV